MLNVRPVVVGDFNVHSMFRDDLGTELVLCPSTSADMLAAILHFVLEAHAPAVRTQVRPNEASSGEVVAYVWFDCL